MAKSVLIIDDTAFMRMTLGTLLEKNGYKVIGEADNGVEAVKLYSELKPDIITMDITMPKMNGIKAIEEIMKINKDAIIIVVSAMGQEAIIMEALNAGAKDFVVKPFKPERVLNAIEKATV